MTSHYYLPISSFSFPELMSAEAISPTAGDVAGVFVGRGSFPTRTTGDIPVNPIEDLLIVYSKPVVWGYTDGNVMDYPLVIEFPVSAFDEQRLAKLALPSMPPDIDVWAYPKTVFFPCDGSVRYLFRTDEEMLQQIQRLSPFQEVKDIALVKDSCESFEDLRESPQELPDCIGDEIRKEVSRLGIALVDKTDDLRMECRTGACLGYRIGNEEERITRDMTSAEALLNTISDKGKFDSASRMMHSIRVMLKNFAHLVAPYVKVDYEPIPSAFKSYFRYNGRQCIEHWPHLEQILQRCVDFIASYPPEKWNWYGNEERFVFMRDVWNEVLMPQLEGRPREEIDAMRKEVEAVCRHFRSPNALGVDAKDLHSPLVQAFYIALKSSGETKALSSKELMVAKRPDYCLALYGALKGYAYFSRLLIPERIKRVPTRVSREDILTVVSAVKGRGGSGNNWRRIIKAVNEAMKLEMERQSAKAFLYILNNLMPRNERVYKCIERALRNDSTEYDYVGFRARIRKILDETDAVTEEQRNIVLLAVELEDKRRDPVAFKYILDDCIREGGKGEEYRREAQRLMDRLDLLYGGEPSDIEDLPEKPVEEPRNTITVVDDTIDNKLGERDLFGNEIPVKSKRRSTLKKGRKGKTK